MNELLTLKQEWESEEYTDGETLDGVLDILETTNPNLYQLIMKTDGEELTDVEALEMVWKHYDL